MADQRITELTELGVEPAAGDLLVVVDIDASGGPQTKKVSFADFADGFVTLDGVQTITGAKTFNSSSVQTFEDDIFVRSSNSLFLLDSLNTAFVQINNQTSILRVAAAGSTEKLLLDGLTLALVERPTAPSDTTAQGQFWVRDDTPNVPMFTDDAGTDIVLGAGLAAGSVTNATLRWNGSAFVENPRVQTNLGILEIFANAGLTEFIRITQSGVSAIIEFDDLATSLRIGINSAAWNQLVLGDASAGASLVMGELAAVPTVVAGLGQVWVRNDTPNVLMFTDDDGTDFVLNAAGAQITGTPVDNQVALWNNATNIEGDSGLTFDGTTLTVTETGGAAVDLLQLQETTDNNRLVIRYDGSSIWEFRDAAAGAGNDWIRLNEAGGGVDLLHNSTVKLSTGPLGVNIENNLKIGLATFGSIKINEGGPAGDEAGYGQAWVRNDTPNTFMFTDDAGTDFIIGGAVSAAYTRNATVVEDRTLLASASATTINNNNVLAALIADLQTRGTLG